MRTETRGGKSPGTEEKAALSPKQEAQHQTRAAVTLVPSLRQQPAGPAHRMHGSSCLRHALGWPVQGAGFQRQTPLRLTPGPGLAPRGAGGLMQGPGVQPLDPERQRKEGRYAL
jgi:hypothetical protein